jgi:hypothetical protein
VTPARITIEIPWHDGMPPAVTSVDVRTHDGRVHYSVERGPDSDVFWRSRTGGYPRVHGTDVAAWRFAVRETQAALKTCGYVSTVEES